MANPLTVPVQDALYLTPAARMSCRESIAKVSLALAEYYTTPPSARELPSGMLAELDKVMDLV